MPYSPVGRYGKDAERIADAIEASLGVAGTVRALSRLGR